MRKPYIGGQAVMEGVMMRSPKSFVVTVRRPDGTIAIREEQWNTLLPKLTFLRWPLFRGAVVLLESLQNGFSALKFSAEHAIPAEPAPAAPASKSEGDDGGLGPMMGIATLMMVALFIATPHLLAYGVSRLVGGMETSGFAFHIVDGFFRIAILLGYILLISRSAQAKRLFQYHGAEHKAIWAYESHLPLTVENARKFGRQHPRCGTSFIFVVVMVSVLVHIAVVPLIPQLSSIGLVNQLLLVLIKVPLAFPIAGLAYELQRVSAKDNPPAPIRWLTAPGMWMQNITTREPDDDQLEIAVLSLERALAREEGRAAMPEGVKIYPDYAVAVAA